MFLHVMSSFVKHYESPCDHVNGAVEINLPCLAFGSNRLDLKTLVSI